MAVVKVRGQPVSLQQEQVQEPSPANFSPMASGQIHGPIQSQSGPLDEYLKPSADRYDEDTKNATVVVASVEDRLSVLEDRQKDIKDNLQK